MVFANQPSTRGPCRLHPNTGEVYITEFVVRIISTARLNSFFGLLANPIPKRQAQHSKGRVRLAETRIKIQPLADRLVRVAIGLLGRDPSKGAKV